MIKKIMIGCLGVTLLSLALLHNKTDKEAQSELTKENIEALAFFSSIENWWNSKDYDCISTLCNCILFEYTSDSWTYAGKGNGTAAHAWQCKGCSKDCVALPK